MQDLREWLDVELVPMEQHVWIAHFEEGSDTPRDNAACRAPATPENQLPVVVCDCREREWLEKALNKKQKLENVPHPARVALAGQTP